MRRLGSTPSLRHQADQSRSRSSGCLHGDSAFSSIHTKRVFRK